MSLNISRPTPVTLTANSATIPPDCKQTGIGAIPQDWAVRSLRSLLRSAPSYGINAAAVPFDDSLPTYVRITDISQDNQFKPLPRVSVKHPHVHAFYLEMGDLVFARTGASVGKSYLYAPDDGALVFAGFLIRVRPDPEQLNPTFLSYCVQSKFYWDWVTVMSTRSGQSGINGKEYGTLLLPRPPTSEQRAIVEVLSDVDGLLGALDALITKKRAIKQAAMQQLLTGTIRLPGLEGAWQTKRLGDICTHLPTANNPRADLSEYGKVEYIHYGDVHAHDRPVLNCTCCDLPRIAESHVSNATLLQDGDLVMVISSEDLVGVGKSVEVQGVTGRYVVAGLGTILYRGNRDNWAMGFKAYLQFIPEFRSALMRIASGISVYAISKKQLADVEFALPPFSEQRAIVAILSDMDSEIATLQQRRDKTRAIKQGMMQALLTGRVRLVKP